MRSIFSAALIAMGLFSHTALADPDQDIRHSLQTLQPGLPIESVSESPLAGVYQVHLTNGQQLYASGDGKFLLQGNLFEVRDGKPVNLTEQARGATVAKRLKEIPAEQFVTFPAKSKKTEITVFTDVTCPYCRKLHGEIEELNAQGVEVRYLAWPREGLDSSGYKKMAQVWCAKDRPAALSAAIAGEKVAAGECDNPVAQQYALGQSLGVQGTPAIFLADGQQVGGYVPAGELAKAALEASGKKLAKAP